MMKNVEGRKSDWGLKAGVMQGNKKRHKVGSSTSLVSAVTISPLPSERDNDLQSLPFRVEFEDPSTADVVIHLLQQQQTGSLAAVEQDSGYDSEDPSNPAADIVEVGALYVHSQVLAQCRYFAALLSERWLENGQKSVDQESKKEKPIHISLCVGVERLQESYVTTIRLLYSKDFAGVITNVCTALSILPIAAELLYDDCISACVRFLEAVPWTKEEERQIVQLVPCLQLKESSELLSRLIPPKENAVEDMLNGLVYTATHSHQNGAKVKAFVSRLLSGHASRDTVRLVLEKAFGNSLRTVKDSVEEYASPNVRGRHDEIEALQRQNLHAAVVNGRHLLWIVERMIELRVADLAVMEWSQQGAFTANLKRAFGDDTCSNIAPGLPAIVLRSTCGLASAVAAGSVVASRQVRLKLVKDWLPVLVVSRESASSANQNKQLHLELEDVFLRIILTLPMADAQKLLQQCLSFATRNVEDCPHLVTAFNIWFKRASQGTTMAQGSTEPEQG
ncbi:unnamed protein product [Sphagnum jensenii]|uniref:At3g05675-like ankyrin-like domain-containing protein n=1 Tax=Sphagnum jensenii TaxID=128206 RepID=A0ABP1A6U7_9BRYO